MEVLLKILKYVLMYAPALLGFHTWLYAKSPKYYFHIVKLTTNRNTTWSINCEFKLESIEEMYRKIEDVFKRKYKNDRYHRPVNMKNKKLYECGVYNILIQDDFDTGEFSSQKIFFRISPLTVTLDAAEEKLQELRELFNDLERELKPQQTIYNLDIYYQNGNNPFFGLMIQRLGKKNVSHFECFFPIESIIPKKYGKDRNQHFLRVYKDKLTINETSFDILEETAKRALLFK